MLPFRLQAQTRAARDVYLSTGLSCTLLSYIAPYRATLQPPELRCALFWATLHHVELRCTLLSYAAFNWAMLNYGSPSELSCTLLSYIAPYWATLQPPELCCAQFWSTLRPVELRCTLLSYAAFKWAMLHPIWANPRKKSQYGPRVCPNFFCFIIFLLI